MACTKNTARKTASRLPHAKFTPTGEEERRKHHRLKLRLLRNQIASDSEESPAQQEEWMSITPTLERGSSPVVARTLDKWNVDYEQAQAAQNMEELDILVQDNPSTPLVDVTAEKLSPAAPTVNEELPTPTSTASAVFTETVAEKPRQPLLLARRATAVPATPTPAAKCPRPEHRRRPRKGQPTKKAPALSALQEIKCLQIRVDPIIPLLPFLWLVRDIVWELGHFKLRRETILALREAAEDYIVGTFVGANLIVMNRGQCTLQAKDLWLCRELRGEEESIGATEASKITRRKQWRDYRAARLTPSEDLAQEINQKRKQRQLLQQRKKIKAFFLHFCNMVLLKHYELLIDCGLFGTSLLCCVKNLKVNVLLCTVTYKRTILSLWITYDLPGVLSVKL